MIRDKDKIFSGLFKQHYTSLLVYANRYLNDKDEAKDVVQEVFTELYRRMGKMDLGKNIAAGYLYTSVKNKALNILKHNKIVNQAESALIEKYKVANLPDDDFFKNPDLIKKLYDAIENLPDKCKQIFKLNRFDGLKNSEIAEYLGISIKTVENQMTNALKKLKNEISQTK